ncbi:MAG: DUF1523 family protein [Paracoccaceae bacterium]|nr:DUF1523 family protein [Paracoccaceae bacterium]
MRKIKWGLISVIVITVVAFFHYSLPSRDIVRVVNTDVKRMDVGTRGWWWAEPDAGTEAQRTRDVRFINSVWPNGKPRVYRNEDTSWGFPPYLKFDSSNLTAQSQDWASTEQNPVWVVVTHYGWRIKLLSMFPNAISVRKAEGPDETLIPWFNIVFLSALAWLVWTIYAFFRRLRRRHVDPVIDGIEDTVTGAYDTAQREAGEAHVQAMGLWGRLRRWLDSWRPKDKRRY